MDLGDLEFYHNLQAIPYYTLIVALTAKFNLAIVIQLTTALFGEMNVVITLLQRLHVAESGIGRKEEDEPVQYPIFGVQKEREINLLRLLHATGEADIIVDVLERAMIAFRRKEGEILLQIFSLPQGLPDYVDIGAF